MVQRKLVLVKAGNVNGVNEVIDMNMVSNISGDLVVTVDKYVYV